MNPGETQITPEPQPSVWRRVTPFSKYATMALFIAMPFIGGYVGYHYAPVKVVEVERVVEVDTLPVQNTAKSVTVGSLPSSATVANYCVRVNPDNEYSLYTNVRNQLIVKYPELSFKKWVRDGHECLLADGTYIALVPFINNSDTRNSLWGSYIVEYDKTASLTHISEAFDIAGGEIYITEMRPEYSKQFEFIMRVVDPCYLAHHYYSYNLETKELFESKEGGDRGKECWDAFNAATGGV